MPVHPFSTFVWPVYKHLGQVAGKEALAPEKLVATIRTWGFTEAGEVYFGLVFGFCGASFVIELFISISINYLLAMVETVDPNLTKP